MDWQSLVRLRDEKVRGKQICGVSKFAPIRSDLSSIARDSKFMHEPRVLARKVRLLHPAAAIPQEPVFRLSEGDASTLLKMRTCARTFNIPWQTATLFPLPMVNLSLN